MIGGVAQVRNPVERCPGLREVGLKICMRVDSSLGFANTFGYVLPTAFPYLISC